MPTFRADRDVHETVDPVEGRFRNKFPFWKRTLRSCKSRTVIVILTCCVLACIVGVIAMRVILLGLDVDADAGDSTLLFLKTNAATIAGVMNYLQIVIMGMIWTKVARKLNDYENHRTATEYVNRSSHSNGFPPPRYSEPPNSF